ncbi:uncharacterized protein NFIA_098270 [Aspergillus fischeri NRRL 181]|uniref:Uncharacterized protein n=1 Tax=Neosartorya fischeri (strain ATCC 1020 / DSM 3700 / CBS 544.65 / FGSC A1164 / JCM 1740 / NRRL 181 / WB 181) TaxID=331117 RepID=A1DBF8_NEOFI|nr:conserved hypothetical protein [Aspergillus fischeri NRRL 181]EAW20198.1 conserved hypothetical protein [Aspergillus fischeri NRRL 181]KAG2006435.1 hypothetical protein GB937_008723 [Aspergillus fischeri]
MSDNSAKRGTGEKSPNDPRKQADSRKSDPESQNPPSLANRIQNSAAGLARSAFNAAGSSAGAAQVLGSGSKAGPSSSASSSALAAAEQYRETATPTSSNRASTNHPAASFRSSSAGQQGAFELPPLTEDEFQRTYDESQVHSSIDFPPSTETETDTGKGKGKASKTLSDFSNIEPSSSSSGLNNLNTAWQNTLPTTATPLPSDGEAVVSLLSDASFDPEFPSTAEEPFEPIETELLPPQLTPSEIKMIESFRRHAALETSTPTPATEPLSQTHRLTSFSLVPDIESVLDSVPAAQATDATALRDAVLMGLPGAAEWIAVEERYHDEVWGYLRPTLEAAAKEMEERKEQGAPVEDGPAVRRLKMILRHMQT